MPYPLRCPAALGLAALIAMTQPAQAIEDRADIDPSLPPGSGKAVAWKATYGLYRSSTDGQASDVNLRGNTTDLTF